MAKSPKNTPTDTSAPKPASKAAAAKASVAKSAAAKAAKPTLVSSNNLDVPVAAVVTELGKKDFLDRVSEAAGVKRGTAKKIVDAVLMELGDTLQRGENVNLPPLGKLSVNRMKEAPNAHIMITKIRRSKSMVEAAKAPDEPAEFTDEKHD